MPSVTTREAPARARTRVAALAKWAGIALAALVVAVIAARFLRQLPQVQEFLLRYPGHTDLPPGSPTGMPAWLGWEHFLNTFFLVLIIRSGWLVRTTTRPKAYWTRNNSGLLRTKGKPTKISLELWFHLTLDVLWLANGALFVVLLAVTGRWVRLVPTTVDALPNAASAALQYLSLDWPHEDGWTNYNSLQMLAYFTVVFVAAPLAALTGLRMSPAWPREWTRANKAFPLEVARAVHFPVMFFFVAFVIVHVALVFATGALANLNHMYASSDSEALTGLLIFAASVVVIVAAWMLARPLFLRPIAGLMGKVSK